MQKMHVSQSRIGVISFGSERHDGTCGSRRVDEVERGAEQAGKGIGERQPLVIGSVDTVSLQPVNVSLRF